MDFPELHSKVKAPEKRLGGRGGMKVACSTHKFAGDSVSPFCSIAFSEAGLQLVLESVCI